MNKQLFALTPITDTEGLEDGQYRCLNKYGIESDVKYSFFEGKWFAKVAIELYQLTHYLRPLPEGTVAVPHDLLMEIKGTLTAIAGVSSCNGSRQLANGLLTKLAQMGECKQ